MMTRSGSFRSVDARQASEALYVAPERYADLLALLRSAGPDEPVIARGAGLSYAPLSWGGGATSVLSRHFDRVLDWRPESGRLTVEPGFTVGGLVDFSLRRGLLPAALPGHPRITIGGCVGAGVHGKDHFRRGAFANSVRTLVLLTAGGQELSCSPRQHPDLFAATLGGYGLTGFVTAIEIELGPLAGNALRVQRHPVGSLVEGFGLMQELADGDDGVDFLYSWNDLSSTARLGRGVVFAETLVGDDSFPAAAPVPVTADPLKGVRLPLLNRWTCPLVSRLFLLKEKLGHRTAVVPLTDGLFPFAGREYYFRSFGRAGFHEYQALFNAASFTDFEAELRKRLAGSRATASFGSLKLFRDEPPRLLRFAGGTSCITLNVPHSPEAGDLLRHLDRLTLELGGKLNLAKTSRRLPFDVSEMFPEAAELERLAAGLGRSGAVSSLFLDRLGGPA